MSNVTKLSDAIKFALFVGAASSVASVSALAQDAATEATTLDRMVVTAQKREESLQDSSAHARGFAAAVAFEIELGLEGLVDRFDDLAEWS